MACHSASLSVRPHGNGNGQLGMHVGSSALCGYWIYQMPRNDRREIFVGVDQERDPYAEISGIPSGKSVLRTGKGRNQKTGKGGDGKAC